MIVLSKNTVTAVGDAFLALGESVLFCKLPFLSIQVTRAGTSLLSNVTVEPIYKSSLLAALVPAAAVLVILNLSDDTLSSATVVSENLECVIFDAAGCE